MRKEKGFSLIEIMVVLVIIGVIVAGVGGRFLGKADESRVKQVKVDFKTIEKALSLYKLDNFKYPTGEQGLEALVERPSVDPIPRQWQDGGYLDNHQCRDALYYGLALGDCIAVWRIGGGNRTDGDTANDPFN